MPRNLLLLIILFSMSNCTIDDSTKKSEFDKQLTKIELRSISGKDGKSHPELINSPSKELNIEIYNQLTQWEEWEEFNSKLNSENCKLKWNWSIFDKINDEDYTVIIPVTNDQNAICLYIMYSTYEKYSQFQIMTIKEIIAATENFTKLDIDEKYLPFIIKTATYDYYYYHRTDSRLSNWFEMYFNQ